MKKPFHTIPLFIPALPVFFVLHGYQENLGYIHPRDAMALSGVYLILSLFVFGIFLLLYRRIAKAALAALFVLVFYFFFGAIHDFLKAHLHPLSRYAVILPAFLVAATAWLLYLRRTTHPFSRLFFYLNILFLLYILVDAAGVVFSAGGPVRFRNSVATGRDTISFTPFTGAVKPDIYFLLFDAYSSSLALKEQYHYDNGDFDRFLTQRGFHLQAGSRSNYKYTILSMPSILNMCYLDKLKDVKGGPVAEYYYLSDLIRDNSLMTWLHSIGYDIVNCSIFDLRGQPSPIAESLLPLQTRLITDQTLYSRFSRDIGWNFPWFAVSPLAEKQIYQSLKNDDLLMDRLMKASATPSPRPRFFYGHFNIPHPPYYFDKNGHPRKVTAIYASSDEDRLQDYLDYLSYTNKRAEAVIDSIRKNSGGAAVIVLMGDHGLRYHDRPGYNPPSFVENLNAVYFPKRDYGLFYDSISGVNQFRVILNSLFGQKIPLLKDSIVNIKDKK